ncbi:MAG: hypothetical protein H7138_21610 [Myxococcales bacterium]|nr:hypothetical protein [Myxococcales bacterium]
MIVSDLDGDVLALFQGLVEDPEIARRERRTPKPDLSPVLKQLVRRNVPIQRRPEISVPLLDEPFTADFAYQNGVRNLVKAVGRRQGQMASRFRLTRSTASDTR